MWKAIKKILSGGKENVDNQNDFPEHELVFKNKQPDDVTFAANFNAGGGHFLYCENNKEVIQNLHNICSLEQVKEIICNDADLKNMVAQIGVYTVDKPETGVRFSLIKCEYLIAYDGGIMLSSHQTYGRSIDEFPDNFIIYAKTSQIVNNLSEALQKIKAAKGDNLPTNITSIRGKNMHDFGSIPNAKNIYLLLVE